MLTTVRTVPSALPYKRASIDLEREMAIVLGVCDSIKRLETISRLPDMSLILGIAGPQSLNATQDAVVL